MNGLDKRQARRARRRETPTWQRVIERRNGYRYVVTRLSASPRGPAEWEVEECSPRPPRGDGWVYLYYEPTRARAMAVTRRRGPR